MEAKYAIAIFCIGSVVLALGYHHEVALAAIVALFSAIVLAIDKWKYLKEYVIAVIVGGSCENLSVALGGWSYANSNFLFAPLWLPLGWGFSFVLFEDAFGGAVPVKFSWWAILLAIGGAAAAAFFAPNELLVLALFVTATIVLFYSGFYKKEEFKLGLYAAALGTIMETISILMGNWEYSAAVLETPLWLPLCWFNAFLIMRRIVQI